MDVPIRPGDPLAQPTRARVFALLAELRRRASTEELAERLRLHPNGVRSHLERLHDAGLVVRERERQARGRPRDAWAISPDAQPGGDPPTGYAQLARWLVRSLTATGAGVRDVEATGRRIGRDLAAAAAGDDDLRGEQRMHDALVALGFQPARERGPGDHVTYRLRNCPYREAVRERQPLVCGLHRGLTRGMLDALDPQTKLAGFVPKDPDTAGCLIELRRRGGAAGG
ncbi:helix-turn-helix domain-containing protein [Conexibacter arvalis]|uniref:Putative ArsR family transcriptional regulator n=1 Tax=Conexibacter arvalis TaxID=912552 RepID=A0A840I7J2_9ACTN|nr:putative ArsR family transcriptional regulator [Conexibacter arvalis]